MRTTNSLKHLLMGALVLTAGRVAGQTSVLGNTGIASNFLGWNSNPANNFPLQIRHDGSWPIEFWTSLNYRGQINPTTSYVIGMAPLAPRNGFMLLSGRSNFMQHAKGPFSRLHLVDDVGADAPIIYAQDIGYRQWMRNGITFTGNSDQAYLGQKYSGNDNTDFVVQWSDNPSGSPWGTDRMKFIFSSQITGTHTGMGSEYGLEAIRLWPRNADEVNVGIGDFFAAGSVDPTERLDVLNGRVRIRKLPDDPQFEGPYKVMVVDNSLASPTNAERGVVKWIDPADLPGGGGGCGGGWSLQGNNACTAWNGNPCIPQAPDKVGIGTNAPGAKLDVFRQAALSSNPELGLRSTLVANAGTYYHYAIDANVIRWAEVNAAVHAKAVQASRNYGVDAEAYGTHTNWGVKAVGHFGLNNFGIQAQAYQGGTNIGVSGEAWDGDGYNYGVFGSASGTHPWAGYFSGDVNVTGTYYNVSDGTLKTNVQDMQGGLGVVMSLNPKTYDFQTDEYPQMNLPEGQHAGMLAQDLEAVLPGLVKTAIQPAVLDSMGNEVTAQVEYSAVSYVGLIPYLVDAIQEQQATITQLQAQIDQCCASQGSGLVAPQGDGNTNGVEQESDVQEQRLVVRPDPFTDHTTLYYYVPKGGKVSLQVSGSDGRALTTLREEQVDAGQYSLEWNTTQLAPGTYFCALFVDGNVVVKRAVKVGR